MKTIIVPTDFSNTAKAAAQYAIKLASELKIEKIILYNAYQSPPILTEATVPVMPMLDIDTLKDISQDGMKNFKNSVSENLPAGITLEEKSEFGVVQDGVNELCNETKADLVVMGITGTSKLEEVLIGSTATSVMKHTNTPVIIVPENAVYSSIKNVMFACDFKKVVESTPVQPIKALLEATGAKLHVLNVYEGTDDISADKTYEKELLGSLLAEFQPQFHFVSNNDFIEGINNFVDTHAIDLIITIPRKHGFFDGLFKERHTKKLAFHSHVPLMYIQEMDNE